MLINTAWPEMRIWLAYLQSSAGIEKIIRWRLDPNPESYLALEPYHRPTATQLSTVHPPIIDWVYFPSLRDQLIKKHSHSPYLDQLLCEHVRTMVVEVDISDIIIGLGDLAPKKGYFRIWDLIQTITNEEPYFSGNANSQWDALCSSGSHWDPTGADLPSPFLLDDPADDVGEEGWTPMLLEDIFRSKKAASRLLKVLRLDGRERDFQNVKVDPIFAVNHPELCDDLTIFASGIDCTRRDGLVNVPLPAPLTRETIRNYKLMLAKTVVA